MANTTFNGPVRSLNGFQTLSVNSTTGTETVNSTIGNTTSVSGTVAVLNATAPVAGGSAAFLATSTAGLGVYFGSGAPTVAAAQGSLYLRTDGSSASTRAYVNSDGGKTWVAITTAS